MDKIGNYRIISHIGHGAMGSVEKAEAPDGAIVAIKTLFPQFAYEAEYVKRFKREAEIARKLSHPNVVRILDVGDDDSGSVTRPYIVMEYVDGKSLADTMHDRGMASANVKRSSTMRSKDALNADRTRGEAPAGDAGHAADSAGCVRRTQATVFTPEETIRIMRQLAGVLQAAEDIGLLHRDVKPQNIMLDAKGNAKLLDFGLAKDTDALVSVLSMTGQSIGTPPYMSPEQHEGKRDIDIRSDLYALGCTAYHMLTGRPPFEGPTNSAFARQHCEEIPEPAVKLNEQCPLNLSQLIERLLAKRPEDRHQTPAELIEDLNRVERGEVPLKLYKPKKSRKHNPHAVWITAAVAVLLCAGAFIGWHQYRSRNADGVIKAAVADARSMIVENRHDEAQQKLHAVIMEFPDKPELTREAEKLRDALPEMKAKWLSAEEQRKLQAEAARLAREEAERGRERAEAETSRQRDLHNTLREAARLSRSEDTCGQAAELINQAYRLCNTDEERAGVAEVDKLVREALAKVRPWAAVADFTLDSSVEVKITGSAVAVRLEQALGREFRLVSRSQVDKALRELRFQSSDLSDRDKARKFGRMVGAEYLVTGSVVQIGRKITLACQCFNIETGAIRQTAEVSAVDVDDFNYMIREAAVILGMDNEQKSRYTDEKFNYPERLEAGRQSFASGDYDGAVRHFRQALGAKRTPEAETLLKTAETRAAEQRLLNERKARYELATSRGNKLLLEHKWQEAEAAFGEALKISGYEYDKAAAEGVKTARGGAEALRKRQLKDKFDSLLASGNAALQKQDWPGAETAFNEALKVEGYGYAEAALEGVRNARGGAELMRKRHAADTAFREAMAAATEALKKAVAAGFENDAFKALCDAGTGKLDELESSAHWHYVAKNSRQSATELAGELKKVKADYGNKYLTGRAMREYEKAYEQAAQLYRASRLLDKNDPKAREKCSEALKAITGFAGSVHYRHATGNARERMDGLKSQAEAYLKTLWNGPTQDQPWTVPGLNMQFVYVAPGSFQMGSNDGRDNERPVHRVTLTNGYWIGKYEVTQGEYQEITGTNPSHFKGGRRPVEKVGWNDAVEFCRKLTARERAAGRLPAGYEYRLPTEAEWEFAARGGNNSKGYKYSGSDNLESVAWYYENSGNSRLNDSSWKIENLQSNNCQTHEVGTKSPNELGIHDMSGNVWEWCHDWYGSYSGGSATNPTGAASGSHRVLRGGGWYISAADCRSASRSRYGPSGASIILGFRVLLGPSL